MVDTGAPARRASLARPELDAVHGVLVTLALIAVAAVLTAGADELTDGHTSLFYLSAAVAATWLGGLGCGALVVVAGSVLTMHAPVDPPATWQLRDAHAWERLAMFAVIGLAFAYMVDRLRSYSRALARNHEKLRTVLELVPVGIAIVDADDPETPGARVNAALAEMIGTDRRRYPLETPGSAEKTFLSEGEPAAVAELPVHRAMSSGRITPRQYIDISQTGGRVVHAIAQAAPLREDGATRGAVASYVDLTEAREREEQLARAYHAKDEFLGMISHELKTPLTIIAGNAEILARRWRNPDETIGVALQDTLEASHRLLRNIDNLLAISRTGDRALDVEPLDLRVIMQDTVEPHTGAAHPIHLKYEEAIALGVPTFVSEVLENLLTNAEKYSPAGSDIEVVAEPCGNAVRVAVLDHGVGLSPDELEDVFEPFYRSGRSSESIGGIGIGLSVCRRLVAAMGGRIWAAQREGGGAEFAFTLPRLQVDKPG